MFKKIKAKIDKFFLKWLRKEFVSNEVRPGRMMVCWRDVDNMVYGWNMPADEELALMVVSQMIRERKAEKLKEIIEAKRK